MRKQIVGKVVQFEIVYKVPGATKDSAREYVTLFLQTGARLPQLAVSEGWVKVRDDKGTSLPEGERNILEKIEALEAEAKAASKGIWAGKDGGKLETRYEIADTTAFADEWKGKPLDGIIERVLTADRMIIRLMVKPDQHIQTLVLVADIRAPSPKRTDAVNGKDQDAEAYGEEAHLFVVTRLLLRGVTVGVVGVSPQGQLVCTVTHPNGNIAEILLREGLARCVDHHSTMLGADMAKLREAEKHAKAKKLGMFQGHVVQKSPTDDLEATVSRVQTADTIYIRQRTGGEKRVNLSSIRQPKPSDPKQAPFQAEAKEFLRKKLIGKHVRVTVDGKKAASEGYEERDVATVVQNNKNIALQLVEAGYASVIRHRRDDGNRT